MAEPGFFVGPVLQRCEHGTALKERDHITFDTLGPILQRKAPAKGAIGAKELIAAYLIDYQARPRIRPTIWQ